MYKTSQVAKLLHVSPMTVGRWVETFAPFLSHTSKNTDGTERRFNDEDIRVLSLVWQMREQGNEFDLITAALASGERAESIESIAIIPAPSNQLALQNRIKDLETELATMTAKYHETAGREKLLRELLTEAHARLYKSD